MTDDELLDAVARAFNPSLGQVVAVRDRIAARLKLSAEYAEICCACGEEIPEGEGKWSWTLDARICTGCGQDGDNP